MMRLYYFSLGLLLAFLIFWVPYAQGETWSTPSGTTTGGYNIRNYPTNDVCKIWVPANTPGSSQDTTPLNYLSAGSIFNPTATTSAIGGAFLRTSTGLLWKSSGWSHNETTYPNRVFKVDEYFVGGTTYICQFKYSDDYSAVPAHCSDNGISGDESGIDCGGSCPSSCVQSCPEDFTKMCEIGDTNCWCEKWVPADAYGNCPYQYGLNGLVTYNGSQKMCGYETSTGLAKAGISSEDVAAIYNWNSLPSGAVGSGGTFNVVSMYDASSVDNGNGTSTTIGTTSTTGTSGAGGTTSSTSQTTAIVNQATGAIVSSSTISNFHIGSQPAAPTYLVDHDATRFGDRFTAFKTELSGAPIFEFIEDIFSPSLGAGNAVAAVSLGSYGSTEIDLSEYDDVWAVLRLVLLFCGLFVAGRIVMVNK